MCLFLSWWYSWENPVPRTFLAPKKHAIFFNPPLRGSAWVFLVLSNSRRGGPTDRGPVHPRPPSITKFRGLVAQNTLRRNAAAWKRNFQYAIFVLEFAGPLVSKRGFDPQYASVFDRYAASTLSLLDMFRFSFNTKFGKDKKPIKIRPANAEYAAGRNSDTQRNAKETQRVPGH